MKLILLERLKLLEMLPAEGSFVTLNIVNKLRESLAPTEAELKEFELVEKDGQLTWNEKGREEREIEVGEKATDIIVKALKQLDSEGKLTAHHLSIYEKFVVNKD